MKKTKKKILKRNKRYGNIETPQHIEINVVIQKQIIGNCETSL